MRNLRLKSTESAQNISELKAILLANRKVDNQQQFFSPKLPGEYKLHELGFDHGQVIVALKRLKEAKKNNQSVVIFGDYDADGITATAVLWQTMHALGFRVRPFIPSRFAHGYGLSEAAFPDIFKEGRPDLVITVDNGIVAHEAVDKLVAEGVEVIITDHHQADPNMDELESQALAVIHTTQLAGVGVAWYFARELAMECGSKNFEVDELLDIVAIGTIADQVPLLYVNRSLAWHGIKALQQTKRAGFLALFDQADIKQAELSSETVSFSLAPRINALGRLEHGLDALRLLCSNQQARADQLAKNLGLKNSLRQELTLEQLKEAKDMAETQAEESLIVVYSPSFHEGVIGLIAGRLVESLAKPVIVMGGEGPEIKGSARSVVGVNIVELIRQVSDDLISVGGHPLAAGFSVELEKLEGVIEKLHALALKEIDPDLLVASLDVECQLPISLISTEVATMLEEFAPFGQGNRKPVFLIEGVILEEVRLVGSEGLHLKLSLRHPDLLESNLTALFWRHGYLQPKLKVGQMVNLVGSIEVNRWNGHQAVQVIVKELDVSED